MAITREAGYKQHATNPGPNMGLQGNLSGGSEYVNGQPRPGGTNPYGVPALPTLAAAAAPPPQPDYMAEYRRAQAAAQAGIQQQFNLALSDIGQREGLAGQAIGTLPGQLSQIYGASNANIGNAASALDKAQKAAGVTSFMGASQQFAPIQAAIQSQQAGRMADVPLLRLASATEFARQRGALNQARMSAEQDASANDTNFLRQMALSQVQRQQQLEDQQSQRDYETQQAQQQHDWDMEQYQAQQDAKVNSETGLTAAQEDSVRKSQGYARAQHLLGAVGSNSGNYESGWKPLTIEQFIQGVDPQTLKVMSQDYPQVASWLAGYMSQQKAAATQGS